MTEQDRLVLDIFRLYPTPARGLRTRLIREQLDWTETRWAQRLVELVYEPDIMMAEPQLCARARRLLASGNRLKRVS
jgi:hypothetical protein